MDDTAVWQFFERPTQTYHRRYEALRAVIFEGRSRGEVAETFGFSSRTLRQMVYEFRQHLAGSSSGCESPFFGM